MGDFVSNKASKSTTNGGQQSVPTGKSLRMECSLYDGRGRRKYLVAAEREAFLQAALQIGGDTGSFCTVLALSGARVSEVLALTHEQIDEHRGAINFETLKRRKKGVIRAVPVPKRLFPYLNNVHHFREAQCVSQNARSRLWTWSRTTAWRRVRSVMRIAGNPVYLSNPRSLRHAFGAEAALRQVPLNLIKKWMGHARLETTELYTSLMGEEERRLARLTWISTPNLRF